MNKNEEFFVELEELAHYFDFQLTTHIVKDKDTDETIDVKLFYVPCNIEPTNPFPMVDTGSIFGYMLYKNLTINELIKNIKLFLKEHISEMSKVLED